MKSDHRQAGFSIVEVLVALGLFGLLGMYMQRQVILTLSSNKQVGDRYDLFQMGRDLEKQIDCKTLPVSCSSGESLTLLNKDGGVLIAKERTTKLKGWNLAAECGSQNNVIVRVAMKDDAGNFVADPVTHTLLDWEDKRSVLFPAGTFCAAKKDVLVDNGPSSVTVLGGESCVVHSKAELPCNPADPPQCASGYASSGVTLDSFGGDGGDADMDDVFGQRWVRYCVKR